MKVYIVTNSLYNATAVECEDTALSLPQTFATLMEARRFIDTFANPNWLMRPRFIRRVTPKNIVTKLFKHALGGYQSVALATYHGIRRVEGRERRIWFAIYQANI